PARRRPRAALAAAAAAALASVALGGLALGGLALAGGAGAPPASGEEAPALPRPEPLASKPPGEALRPLSPAELEDASRRLRALRREQNPVTRFRGLSEWLEAFAAHPDAVEVWAL